MNQLPFDTVLIANRGEIALRIIQACHQLGLFTVAVYSDADERAPYVQAADQAVHIGPSAVGASYLNQQAILAAAQRSGAQALHPGYGLLAENPEFARACAEAGVLFIGPSPEAIAAMGSKHAAREQVQALGLPVIPGYHGPDLSPEALLSAADTLGFPLLVKAVAGGGGRGMRLVQSAAELSAALASAQREAQQAFGDPRIYLERYLPEVKHIEFQILGDGQGHVVHLLERECSLQRRYQKIVEEAPSPALDPELRAQMGAAAVAIGQALAYRGAGTVEFVFEPASRQFYFLEVNTRLQVEHPVTEMITGQDLVLWQLKLALGYPLSLQQQEISARGHAIECRICAEDPAQDFAPQTGKLELFQGPIETSNVRLDSGVVSGSEVGIDYDSLLAKLICWGEDRPQALLRSRRALSQTRLLGLNSNLSYLLQVLADPVVRSGQMHTRFLESGFQPQITPPPPAELAAAAAIWLWQQTQQSGPQERPWASLPSAWSNAAPRWHQQLFEVAGQHLALEVLHLPPERFECRAGEQAFAVRLLAASDSQLRLEINGLQQRVVLQQGEQPGQIWLYSPTWGNQQLKALPLFPEPEAEQGHGGYSAQMPSRILKLCVSPGQTVEAGQALLVLESMKMETTLCAAEAGTVAEILVTEGETVAAGTQLLQLAPQENHV